MSGLVTGEATVCAWVAIWALRPGLCPGFGLAVGALMARKPPAVSTLHPYSLLSGQYWTPPYYCNGFEKSST